MELIVRAAIVIAGVLIFMPHGLKKTGEAAPAWAVLDAVKSAILEDIERVRADIAESQRARGGPLWDGI